MIPSPDILLHGYNPSPYQGHCNTNDQSGVTHSQSLFKSALQDYERQTGITLAYHPLAKQLQTCQSAESVTALLQEQAQALSKSRESNKIMGSLRNVASVLLKISATAALGQDSDTSFRPVDAIHTGLGILLTAFDGVTSDSKSAIEFLESIESFLNRLDLYTNVPSTPAVTEIIVKIMVELLSTLALATNQIRQGRPKKGLFGENVILQWLSKQLENRQQYLKATSVNRFLTDSY